jgi:hypothetical protein
MGEGGDWKQIFWKTIEKAKIVKYCSIIRIGCKYFVNTAKDKSNIFNT